MRANIGDVLRSRFRRNLVAVRADMGQTQSDMAQLLSISLRSYADLESGRSCCSAATLALFLVRACPDPVAFLDELREALDREQESGP